MAKNTKEKRVTTASPITAEWMAGVMTDIVISPIPEGNKAAFLYAIAQGTFNEDLHQRFIDLLAEHQKELAVQEAALQQQFDALQAEHQQIEQQLTESTIGAMKEIEAAVTHIEQRAAKEIESRAGKREAGAIESIKEKLKKKK